MGMAGGVGLGAAALGQVIDGGGAQAGFYAVIGTGLILIIAALCVRTRAVTADTVTVDREGTPPVDQLPAETRTPSR
jgi:hypothetical protein